MPESEVVKAQKYGPIVAVVNSSSEPDKKYEVRQRADSTYSCNCMGWRFNKDNPRQCRHTRAAAAGGPLPTALPSSRTPQQISAVHAEAQKCAQDIINNRPGLSKATEMIESAIKKFLGTLSTAAHVAVDVTPGVRMITLDD